MERAPGSNALQLYSNLLGILISRDTAMAEPNVSLLYRRHVPQNTLLNLVIIISSSKSFEREKPGTVEDEQVGEHLAHSSSGSRYPTLV